jgi:hypothetical protein
MSTIDDQINASQRKLNNSVEIKESVNAYLYGSSKLGCCHRFCAAMRLRSAAGQISRASMNPAFSNADRCSATVMK